MLPSYTQLLSHCPTPSPDNKEKKNSLQTRCKARKNSNWKSHWPRSNITYTYRRRHGPGYIWPEKSHENDEWGCNLSASAMASTGLNIIIFLLFIQSSRAVPLRVRRLISVHFKKIGLTAKKLWVFRTTKRPARVSETGVQPWHANRCR